MTVAPIRCNLVFEDDIRLEGVIAVLDGISVVISQPFIVGRNPTEEEVDEWFRLSSCEKIGKFKWRYLDGMVISDAHPGNLILMRDGTLVPIDLHIEKVGPDFPGP